MLLLLLLLVHCYAGGGVVLRIDCRVCVLSVAFLVAANACEQEPCCVQQQLRLAKDQSSDCRVC
jgi:hypothetical protein